jgi:thioredoxin
MKSRRADTGFFAVDMQPTVDTVPSPLPFKSMLKSLPLFALAAICSLSSCEKLRVMVGQLNKKNLQAPVAVPVDSQAAEIPKGISEMFPVESRKIVIVDYYADWCGPCRMLSPILEKISGENSNTVLVCKVNVDKFGELAVQEGVKSIPDVRIYRDGRLVDKFVGVPPEAEVRMRIEALVRNQRPLPDADATITKPKEAPIRPMTKDWMPPGVHRR